MRGPSLTSDQARRLGIFIGGQRRALDLSMRQLARDIGGNISTISVIEAGNNLSPTPETLKAIARALQLPVSDLFIIANWLPADELPTLRLYLRAKYRHLDEAAIAKLERYADQLTKQRDDRGQGTAA
jgi:transcriptional regulator with XRE-family HTH domain